MYIQVVTSKSKNCRYIILDLFHANATFSNASAASSLGSSMYADGEFDNRFVDDTHAEGY